MIDLHCHILPGVDDGADTLEDSLAMAEAAVASGITHLLCTPHHQNGQFNNPMTQVMTAVDDLQKALDDAGILLKIFEGQEIRLTGKLLSSLAAGELLTVDTEGRYLLIEFPTMEVPSYTERVFIALLSQGIIPIIVHPERNAYFRKDPNRLIPYLEMGCLAQLTAPSLVGIFGKSIQKTAKEMVTHQLVQLVASDAHGFKKRPFYLKEAYEEIAKLTGDDQVTDMKQVAKDIINGDLVVAKKYREIKTKGLRFWRSE